MLGHVGPKSIVQLKNAINEVASPEKLKVAELVQRVLVVVAARRLAHRGGLQFEHQANDQIGQSTQLNQTERKPAVGQSLVLNGLQSEGGIVQLVVQIA